ncbi:hypothetical protein GYA49_02280 [Candidatus Beckwithbacteria bacterium]|nr:hypothetical protein [Candidatus Beckwithbacteria bacterium]
MSAQNQLPFSQTAQKIAKAKSILILLPQQLSVDSVATGLALYLSLKDGFNQLDGESKKSKSVSIVSSGDVTVAYQRLYGVGSIAKKSGSKNLVITLNTEYDNVEKVSSDNENSKFNLSIEMKEGIERLEKKDVEFSYRGIDADLIITMGMSSTNQIGELITQEPTLFADRDSISFSINGQVPNLGNIKLYDPEASSLAELMVSLLRTAKIRINPDIATNLLAAIEAATNNFTYKATANTFSAIAWCMRVGGKRNHLSSPAPAQVQVPQSSFSTPTTQPVVQAPFPQVQNPVQNQTASQMPVVPEPQTTNQTPSQASQESSDQDSETPQQDWFEPKIYRGGQV